MQNWKEHCNSEGKLQILLTSFFPPQRKLSLWYLSFRIIEAAANTELAPEDTKLLVAETKESTISAILSVEGRGTDVGA